MKFNIEQINVVRNYLEKRFNTADVTFITGAENKVVFQVNEQEFSILCDDDFNVTIIYWLYGKINRLRGGYSIGLLENSLQFVS